MKKRWVFLLFVLFSVVIPILGNSLFAAESGDVQLTYRLKWLFNASVLGDLYAREMGIFEKAGLDVTIKEGGPERDAIRELELGYADFGVASADQVIRARAKGSPVVVLAQLFQVNPLQWIYRTDLFTISRVQDLKGKIVGVTFGGNDETIMWTLLASGGMSERDINIHSVRYDLTPFYRGKADLWPVYVNSQGPIISQKLSQEGERVAFFNPSDYGVRFVANSVVTSERMVRENPDMARRFVRALLKGWEAGFNPDNSKAALTMLARFDKNTPRPILEKQLAMTRELVKPSAAISIGAFDVGAWKQTEAIMLQQKLIKTPVNVDKVLIIF
ncbi:MAG: ABC transporter substrate-binding protein [Thermodesulfobacteriota bacterium]